MPSENNKTQINRIYLKDKTNIVSDIRFIFKLHIYA